MYVIFRVNRPACTLLELEEEILRGSINANKTSLFIRVMEYISVRRY